MYAVLSFNYELLPVAEMAISLFIYFYFKVHSCLNSDHIANHSCEFCLSCHMTLQNSDTYEMQQPASILEDTIQHRGMAPNMEKKFINRNTCQLHKILGRKGVLVLLRDFFKG